MIELKLPLPPSANAIWRSNRSHVHNRRHTRPGFTQAGWEARAQHPDKIEGAYSFSIEAVCPDQRRRDLDNLIKLVGDLLASIGVIEDDRLCQKVSAEWIAAGSGLIVRIEEYRQQP